MDPVTKQVIDAAIEQAARLGSSLLEEGLELVKRKLSGEDVDEQMWVWLEKEAKRRANS
jgi:hypothetical protein